jgi:hypothetical protein
VHTLLTRWLASAGGAAECYGLVVWFDTEFSARFCKEQPVLLSTSPHAPPTHWAQTLFNFKARCVAARRIGRVVLTRCCGAQEPITLAATAGADASARCVVCIARLLCARSPDVRPRIRIPAPSLGSAARPAAQVCGRISIVRSARHRSMDVSIEYEPRSADGAAQPGLRQVMLYEV